MAVLDLVLNPLYSLGNNILKSLPGLLGALIILIIGYAIAWAISWALKNVLQKIEFEKHLLEKTGLKKLLGSFQLNSYLALITKWYVFILFLIPASEVLGELPELAKFLNNVASKWVPNVIGALTLALIGLFAAEYVHQKVIETKAKWAQLIADSLKVIVWIFTALLALDQLGVSVALAEDTLKVVIAGIMLALALGFGLGLKDHASQMLNDLKKKF